MEGKNIIIHKQRFHMKVSVPDLWFPVCGCFTKQITILFPSFDFVHITAVSVLFGFTLVRRHVKLFCPSLELSSL